MSSMSSLFRRGGPLQGPRLLIACFAVIIVFFYLGQPYQAPQQSARIPNPQDGGHKGSTAPVSPGEAVQDIAEEKDEKENMSDKFLEYLKGHSSHGHKSHSPIPHIEHAPGNSPIASPNATSTDPFCAHLPSASDILIVVRTPASDLYSHLPAHFLTTLRCAPFLLYSTVSQNVGPHTVHDALANISDSRRAKHKDFELYDKLQEAQNAVQDLSSLKEDNDHNLDKWSIIPHVISAFKTHPEKKWYIFIESDTYISLSNTLHWLDKLDPTKPLFAGAQVMIGDVELAHSGSGIVLSHAAIHKLSEVAKAKTEDWEEMVGNSCCGDKILAEALMDANVTLHRSFPMIQGETPFSLDWSSRHWCRSALTWHRMTPAILDMMWQFEQAWVKKHAKEGATITADSIPPMLYRDYFQTFLVPLIRASQNRSDWDNLSNSLTYTDESRAQFAHYSVEACRAACDLRDSCVQFAWAPNKCRLGNVVRLGERADSDKRMNSGWLPQRVEKFGEQVGECVPEDAWILPDYEGRAMEDEKRRAERKKEETRKEEERLQAEQKKLEEEEEKALATEKQQREEKALEMDKKQAEEKKQKEDEAEKQTTEEPSPEGQE